MSSLPAQARFMKEQFGGKFVMKTFANNNVDNTWMIRSGEVVLLVEEEWDGIHLQLGGSSHAVRETGEVRSSKQRVKYSRPAGNIGEINEMKKSVLEDLFGDYTNLYEAWVDAFGEDTILSDTR